MSSSGAIQGVGMRVAAQKRRSVETPTSRPSQGSAEGPNLGWNLGRVAGAGIVDHVHLHVVPRWSGDTNFMPVLADVKVLPEHLAETRRKLSAAWPSRTE